MTAFQKVIIIFALVFGVFWFFSWRRPDMTIVYPDNCAFTIDTLFSRAKQLEVKAFIDAAYKKSKSPTNLLPKIESHFPEIKSVIIDMQNPDTLNFSIQTYQPIFLLNNLQAVCQYGKIIDKGVFAQQSLDKLENISFDGPPTAKNISRLLPFFESLIDPILKDFSVRWIDKHAIWLDQKQGQDLSLLVGYTSIPTSHDVALCRDLRGQVVDKACKNKRGKPCKNNTTWVCDLRFDQQVVLFSTNKGV